MNSLTDLHLSEFRQFAHSSPDAILLLHGFPAYDAKNESFAASLAKRTGLDSYVIHYRGLGKSKGKFSLFNTVQDVSELAERLLERGYKHIHLVGHSFGGAIALTIVERITSVKKVIILSPLIGLPPTPEMREILEGFAAQERSLGNMYSVDDLIADAENFRTLYRSQDFAQSLQARGVPLFVLQFLKDEVINPELVRAWQGSLTAKPTYIEVDDNHWFTTQEEKVCAIVGDWIRDG